MNKLEGKIAVVTGGNSGIGLATARLFQEEGARVIVTARSAESFTKAKIELSGTLDVFQADIRKPADIDALMKYVRDKYSKIDVLFANAGIALFLPTEQVSEAFFDDQFNTNVRGLYFTVTRALPLLSNGASVILNASAVSQKGLAGSSVYSATKAAVRSFARTWTLELAQRGIRVNVLSPGPIETPIYAKLGMPPEQVKAFGEQIQKSTPAGRFGQPEEMAKAALFLASSDSSYVYGSDLVADGGFAQV